MLSGAISANKLDRMTDAHISRLLEQVRLMMELRYGSPYLLAWPTSHSRGSAMSVLDNGTSHQNTLTLPCSDYGRRHVFAIQAPPRTGFPDLLRFVAQIGPSQESWNWSRVLRCPVAAQVFATSRSVVQLPARGSKSNT